jgi:cob(I)alamin adenosyltransferase
MLDKGLIQIYTSQSRKHNYAPLGLGLRATGQDLRTLVMCFAPHELIRAETAFASMVPDGRFVFDYSAIEGPRLHGGWHKGRAKRAFKNAWETIASGEFDIVILTGIIHMLNLGMFSVEELLDLMTRKPPNVELVMTGPAAPPPLIERADLVTEMVVTRKARLETAQRGKSIGTVEVVTGDGKGKTTYCLGKVMLAAAMGIRAAFLQFIKSPKPYGEVKALRKLLNVEIKTMGKGFLDLAPGSHWKSHQGAARQAWERCLREIFSLDYGLIALDELNTATHYGLVNPDRVREMLLLRPENLNLLLSGRNAHPDIIAAATTVIEMKEIKHPFHKGIKARRGIEY